MEKLSLPPRLAAIADCVPDGARLADVGTDHGLLPISLRLSGRVLSAVASDICPGPLGRAVSNAESRGAQGIRFVLADGLDGVEPGEADTVVIAGMGGENIAHILSRAAWTRRDVRLILQPMSRPEELRAALSALCLRTAGERLVLDSGRVYPILMASGGESEPYSPAELFTGRYEQICNDALFPRLLSELEGRLAATLSGLARSTRPEDACRREKVQAVYDGLRDMRRRYDAHRR